MGDTYNSICYVTLNFSVEVSKMNQNNPEHELGQLLFSILCYNNKLQLIRLLDQI